MRKYNLSDFTKGWFVGQFSPAALHTDVAEVAIKHYKRGDVEQSHHHKIATEITVIISGVVTMNGVNYGKGDIIVIEPNDSTDFVVWEDTTTCVVKLPSVPNDKYVDEHPIGRYVD